PLHATRCPASRRERHRRRRPARDLSWPLIRLRILGHTCTVGEGYPRSAHECDMRPAEGEYQARTTTAPLQSAVTGGFSATLDRIRHAETRRNTQNGVEWGARDDRIDGGTPPTRPACQDWDMSDGQGPTSERPPGWAAEQPPPYGGPSASPWTAPGGDSAPPSGGGQPPWGPPPPPPGQPPHGQPPHGPPPYGPSPYGHAPYGAPPALRPGIIPLRPLALGDIYDGTIKLIRSNPKAVLGLSAIAALLGAIPLAVAQGFLFGTLSPLMENPSAAGAENPADLYGSLAAQYSGAFASYAISFVAVTVLTGVLTRILGRAVFGGKITTQEAWQRTKGRLPALFGVVGLMALIMLAPVAVMVAVLVVAISADAAGSPAAAGGMILL